MTIRRLLAAPTALLLAAALAAAPQGPPERLDPAAGCTTQCHQELAKGDFVHKPIAEGKCTACHAQPKPTEHAFTAIDDVGASCRTCHKLENKEVVHEPFESMDCTSCHDAHHSATKSLLVGKDEATLCFTCHEPVKQAAGKAHAHGPAADGMCSTCHKAHSAEHPKLLAADPAELCTNCHADVSEAVDAAESVHAPLALGCTGCHDPHGSDHEHVVKAQAPELCWTCHKPLADALAAAKHAHGALAAEKKCLSCHRPHESKHKTLLARSTKDTCTGCHEKPQPRPGAGKPVAAVGAEIAGYSHPHGPVKDGDCTACHEAHVSPHHALLAKPFPERFYAPYDAAAYELCFGCHDPKAFATATSDATGFRDGERNLHFLHVNQKEKGRSCRACHALHGGNGPKLVAETVAFGGWRLPIRWTAQPQGGSCAPGCHKPATYARDGKLAAPAAPAAHAEPEVPAKK